LVILITASAPESPRVRIAESTGSIRDKASATS
jgi:hypothetical protein